MASSRRVHPEEGVCSEEEEAARSLGGSEELVGALGLAGAATEAC
jgi:hypothetical protein